MTLQEMYFNHNIAEDKIIALYKLDKEGNPQRFLKTRSNILNESLGNKYIFKKYLVLNESEFNEPSYNILVEDNIPEALKIFKEGKELSDAEVKSREYALPEKRKFPLPDERHVRSAIRLYSHANLSPEEKSTVAHKIFSKMKKYGISTDEIGEDNPLRKYLKEDAEITSTNSTEVTPAPSTVPDTQMPESVDDKLERSDDIDDTDLGYDYQNTPIAPVPDPLEDNHDDDQVDTSDITDDYAQPKANTEDLEPDDITPDNSYENSEDALGQDDDLGYDYQNNQLS